MSVSKPCNEVECCYVMVRSVHLEMHHEQTTRPRSNNFWRFTKRWQTKFVINIQSNRQYPLIFQQQTVGISLWNFLKVANLEMSFWHAFASQQGTLGNQTSANRRCPWPLFSRSTVWDFNVLHVTFKQLDLKPHILASLWTLTK